MTDPIVNFSFANTSVREALAGATQLLSHAGIDSAQVDARVLMGHALGCEPLMVGMSGSEPVPAEFEVMLARRIAREPLQHILGTAWFGALELQVGPGVFVPRPETEVLADWAVSTLHTMTPENGERLRVLDLCAGTGALAGYIASELHDRVCVTAVELSPEAYSYAQKNVGEMVTLVQGDVTDPQLLAGSEPFDLIVSNPPYVPETPNLAPEVYFDPHMAVFGGDDGMAVIRGMLPTIVRLLRPGGWVGVEHDDVTARATRELLTATGEFQQISQLKDLTQRERFVIGQKK